MTIKERLKVNTIIRTIATKDGTTPVAVRAAIQEAIDEAWENKTPDSTAAWLLFFPDGKKPTIETFIITLGNNLRDLY